MLKRFFLAVLLSFCGALLLADRADEEKLLKLIPSDAEGYLSVDVTDWLTIPAVSKRIKDNPETAKLRAKFGVGPEDLGALAGWGRGDDLVVLAAWRKKVTPEQLFKAPDFTCTKVTVEGTVFYNCVSTKFGKPARKSKSGKMKPGKKAKFCLTVLPGNVFCLMKDAAVGGRYVKTIREKKTGIVFPPSLTGSLRGVLKTDRPDLPVSAARLGCRVTHGPKAVLEGFLSVTTKSPEEASQLSSQGMLMTNMMLASAMQDDQDLAVDLARCLKFGASGSDCTLKIKIPGELLERLGDFAAEQAEQRKAAMTRKPAQPAAGPAAKPAAQPAAQPVAKPAAK